MVPGNRSMRVGETSKYAPNSRGSCPPSVSGGARLLVLLALPLVACDTSRGGPPNVLLVTLDTTRADMMPPHARQGMLPTFQWLASEGAVFEDAVSPVPLTLPAHASMLTGRWPSRHGVRDNAGPALSAEQLTLAEILRDRGFRTAAFVSSVVLQAGRGLAQGFELYSDMSNDPCGEPLRRRPASQTVDAAIGWLQAEQTRPSFGWIHLFDAHRPYELDGTYARAWASPYEAAIGFMDQQVHRLLRVLDERGLLDRTLVIITADHGESFGEHGEDGHGMFVYETTIRVPLLIRGPGIQPRRIRETVRLIDLAPTVLDFVGAPRSSSDGSSLVPLLRGERLNAPLDAYSESFYPERAGLSRLQALRGDRYKLIVAPRPELYDLQRDPGELTNRYADRPQVAAALAAHLPRFESAEPPSRAPVPTPAQTQGLLGLGYIGSGGSLAPARDGTLTDPKDFVDELNALTRPRHATKSCEPAGLRN